MLSADCRIFMDELRVITFVSGEFMPFSESMFKHLFSGCKMCYRHCIEVLTRKRRDAEEFEKRNL